MSKNINVVTCDILKCLEDASQAFRTGNFSSLSEFIETMNTFATNPEPLTPEQTRKLQALAHENQFLIASSITGLRAARERFRQIMTAADGFTGYDNRGQAQSITHKTKSLEHRF